jgi:hypothetical protein
MPTKTKPTSRTKLGSKPKSKISPKVIAAIVVGVVALAGVGIVLYSFAGTAPKYQYSYNSSCPKKTTKINVLSNQIVSYPGASIIGTANAQEDSESVTDTSTDTESEVTSDSESADSASTTPTTASASEIATVPFDPISECVKNSAEAMAYRLYYTAYGKPIDYATYTSYVQKLATNKQNYKTIIPASALTQPADLRGFVKLMYRNSLGRTPSENEINSWVKNISKNKLSRQAVASLFADSVESKNYNSGRFAAFVQANPAPVTLAGAKTTSATPPAATKKTTPAPKPKTTANKAAPKKTPAKPTANKCPGFVNGKKIESQSQSLPVDKGRRTVTVTRQRTVTCNNGKITNGAWSAYK